MGSIAVLTNDLQVELVEKTPERKLAMAETAPGFLRFLDGVRERGHHVVHLQLINLPDDPNAERDLDGRLPLQKGSDGAAILEEFLHPSDVVVEKNKDSGFYETDLDDRLKELGVDTVVVTGQQTQICVQTTAADAFFRGYNVWVPSDCVISGDSDARDRALEWLDGYCATVSHSTEIVRVLDASGELPRKVVRIP